MNRFRNFTAVAIPVPSSRSELGSGVGVTGGVGATGGVGGGAPAGPDDPEGPDGPDGPEVPVGPEEPDGPEGPDVPVGPDDPVDPDVPVGPRDPDDPVEPVDPAGVRATFGPPGISIAGGRSNTPPSIEPLAEAKSARAGSDIIIGKVIASNGDGFIGVSSSSGFGSTFGLRACAGRT